MRFAISIPQSLGGGQFDADAFRRYFADVEQLGYDSAWGHESVLSPSPQLSPLETMSYAAACTRRLRLGCSVLVSTVHSPVHLARAIATLDQLSGGRIDVGIGTGGPRQQFAAFGMTAGRYIARFTEGLEVMKALWTQPRVSVGGEFFTLADAPMEPKPVQRPHPPVWIGASADPALRRAARLGDGFFGSGGASPERFAEQVRVVRAELAQAGRDPAGFPVAKRLYIGVEDDAGRARERVNAAVTAMYGRPVPSIEAAAVAGTPAGCAAAVSRVAAAGAELILFTTLYEPAEQAARLAADVIPRVS